jgi:hypothetical protein
VKSGFAEYAEQEKRIIRLVRLREQPRPRRRERGRHLLADSPEMARPIDFIVVSGLLLFTIALILSGITHPWSP